MTAILARKASFAAICRQHGISRRSGYKWWRRFRQEGWQALTDHSRRPKCAMRLQARWHERILALRRRHRWWGARKLRTLLQRRFSRQSVPAVRTIERWLSAAALVRRHPRRARRGPLLTAPLRVQACKANDVWTLDFKGPFHTADRRRVLPLTVRDLATHYILAVHHVSQPSDQAVRRVFRALFRRYGLPRAVQMDNGAPFAGSGPLGLSRLSVWWLRLGLRLHFSRPASPQDNAAHEQMHQVLKRETAQPPARNLAAQQRRFARWRKTYNELRPHQALHQQSPARHYRPSPRRFPTCLPSWTYPADALLLVPGANGRAWWRGRQRSFGRAFAGERLALFPRDVDTAEVFLGPWLLGTLHAPDLAGLRPARWRSPVGSGKGGG